MRQRKVSFKGQIQPGNEIWYDLRDDWDLIEASMAKQYGIRLRNEPHMRWPEFSSLVSGLMPDTPLGQIVSIRSEKDPKVIKTFTPGQRKIRTDWLSKVANSKLQNKEQLNNSMKALERALERMYST